jgi:hypothetical protein
MVHPEFFYIFFAQIPAISIFTLLPNFKTKSRPIGKAENGLIFSTPAPADFLREFVL